MFHRRFVSLGFFNDARSVLGGKMTRFAVAAFILAAIVMVAPRFADAGLVTLWSEIDLDTNITSEVLWDDEDDIFYYHEYDSDTGEGCLIEIGNPSPDGQSTGLGPDKGDVAVMAEAVKKIGGNPVQETNPLRTPIGLGLVENGTIPGAEIDPWDNSALLTEDIAGGGGGGGFDPGVPIGEQLGKKKQQGKGKDDDGDGDGGDKNETFHDISNIAPEIVDPPPEPVGNDAKTAHGLWDEPVLPHALPNAKNSFVLMGSFAPSTGGRTGMSNVKVPGLGNAGILNGAMNRGVLTLNPVATPTAIGRSRSVGSSPTGMAGPSSFGHR